jgi:hypothetical protein
MVVIATAPLGGCRQRSNDINNIDAATAMAMAAKVTGTICSTVTPTNAEMTLPPNTGHGCANGLDGTTNTSTADAPMGAIRNGKAGNMS